MVVVVFRTTHYPFVMQLLIFSLLLVCNVMVDTKWLKLLIIDGCFVGWMNIALNGIKLIEYAVFCNAEYQCNFLVLSSV
ncbi:hypothetical protein D1115_12230 [Vibrio alfacsensis]|uniref:Uncharacterized protein n=1 Tax=Vibrio alfacsensis TaxID=1074311 RepID=A0ABM6YVR4_9VIBR|nr:hypothetical protein D1115_12230 [Vibrio alfacsensis]